MSDTIEKARALLAQVPPGEWFPHRDMLSNDWQVHTDGDVIALVWGSEDSTGYDVAALIAAAPRLLAALCADLEAARAELAAARAAMPSESVRSILADAHGDDGGDSGYPGEVTTWLDRLSAYHAAHPAASSDGTGRAGGGG